MIDKAVKKLDEKVDGMMDKVKEGQTKDAPVDLPGTFQKRDPGSDEIVEETPADTGRQDDIPVPGAKPPV